MALARGCSNNTSFTRGTQFSFILPEPLEDFGAGNGCNQLIDTTAGGFIQPFYSSLGVLVESMQVCYNLCTEEKCNVVSGSELYFLRLQLILVSQFIFGVTFILMHI